MDEDEDEEEEEEDDDDDDDCESSVFVKMTFFHLFGSNMRNVLRNCGCMKSCEKSDTM